MEALIGYHVSMILLPLTLRAFSHLLTTCMIGTAKPTQRVASMNHFEKV
jgi:hypothetical protein